MDQNQDKEFYRMQDLLNQNIINDDDEIENNVDTRPRLNSNEFSMESPSFKKQISMNESSEGSFVKRKKTKFNYKLKKVKSFIEKSDNKKKNFETNPKDFEVNQTQLYSPEREKEALLNTVLGNHSPEGSFMDIDMVPRAIKDIIIKEKKFSYLNQNLVIIAWMLFFNSMLKENYIAFFAYFIYDKGIMEDTENICLLVSSCFCLQLLSILFISPFYRLSKKLKASFIFMMVSQ